MINYRNISEQQLKELTPKKVAEMFDKKTEDNLQKDFQNFINNRAVRWPYLRRFKYYMERYTIFYKAFNHFIKKGLDKNGNCELYCRECNLRIQEIQNFYYIPGTYVITLTLAWVSIIIGLSGGIISLCSTSDNSIEKEPTSLNDSCKIDSKKKQIHKKVSIPHQSESDTIVNLRNGNTDKNHK